MNILYSSSKQMEANHYSIFEGHWEAHRGSISSGSFGVKDPQRNEGDRIQPQQRHSQTSWRTGTQLSKYPRAGGLQPQGHLLSPWKWAFVAFHVAVPLYHRFLGVGS